MRWRRRYTVDPDKPAYALAGYLLRYYDVDVLERGAVIQFLRTRYMRAVAEWGLPVEACNDVAERAWQIVKKAQERPIVDTNARFQFYD